MISIPLHIDHIGLAVRAASPPVETYRRLGFSVTEPDELMGADADGNPKPLGQQSAHFYFADSYVELSAVTGSVPGNHLDGHLDRYEGLHILALRSDDLEADIARLRAEGLSPSAAMAASRHVDFGVAGTETGTARFAWSAIPGGEMPECFGCIVEHKTPVLVYQKQMTQHDNGATDLTGITVLSEDPEAAAAHFAPYRDDSRARDITILTPDEARSRYGIDPDPALHEGLLGFSVAVRDLDRCATVLSAADIAHHRRDDTIIVPRSAAAGTMLVFAQES